MTLQKIRLLTNWIKAYPVKVSGAYNFKEMKY